MSRVTERWIFWGLAAIGAALGFLLVRHGVNVTDDSDTYIGVARNLADGRGLTVPFTNVLDVFSPARAAGFHGEVPFVLFGPLLSLVLAPFERINVASVDALRVINPLALGATLGVIGLLGYRVTRRSVLLMTRGRGVVAPHLRPAAVRLRPE